MPRFSWPIATYRIDGGVPAGTSMRPDEDGCRIMRTSINNTTMLGNKSTNPRGTEMDELPFKRIRRRKKDNLEVDFVRFSSDAGAGDVYGKLLNNC